MQRILERAALLVKMYLDRRRFRGASTWRFRWRRDKDAKENYAIEVSSRRTNQCSLLSLRRHSTDLLTFEQVFCNNDYELRRLARWPDIESAYGRIVRNGRPLILDLGANVGTAAVGFHLSWPRASIIAVEPDLENYEKLSQNISGIANATAIRAAVANSECRVKIVNPGAAA